MTILACSETPIDPEAVLASQPRPFSVRFSSFQYRDCRGLGEPRDSRATMSAGNKVVRCSDVPRPGTRRFRTLEKVAESLRAPVDSVRNAAHRAHLQGLYSLVWAESQEELSAVRRLWERTLSSSDGNNSKLLADLAALALVQSRSRDEGWLHLEALDIAQRAHRELQDDLAASFNMGLALENAGLRLAAQEAWRRYLAREAEASWRYEGKDRLAEASDPTMVELWEYDRTKLRRAIHNEDFGAFGTLAEAHRQRLFDDFLERSLGDWSESHLARRTDSQRRLRELQVVAELFEKWGAGSFPALRALDAEKEPTSAHDSLARLVGGFSRGVAAYREQQFEKAQKLFRKIDIGLVGHRSNLAAWARYYDAVSTFHSDVVGSGRSLRSLAAEVPDREMVLRARVYWVEGLVASLGGDHEAALEFFGVASSLLENSLGYEASLGAVVQKTSVLESLGREYEAWSASVEALRHLSKNGDHRLWFERAGLLGKYLCEQGSSEVAMLTIREALAIAEAWGNVVSLQEAHYWLGQCLFRQGNVGARSYLEQSYRFAEQVKDPSFRRVLEADVDTVMADVVASKDSTRALSLLEGVVQTYEGLGDELSLAVALEVQGRTLAGRGFREEAWLVLQRAERILLSGVQWAKPTTEPLRLRVAERLYGSMLAQAVGRGDPQLSLWCAEAKRAVSEGRRPPSGPKDLMGLFPRGADVVFYEDVGDVTYVWWVRDQSIEMNNLGRVPTLPSSKQLAFSAEWMARLYDLLLAPLSISKSQRPLLVIPSSRLMGVPFARLLNGVGTNVAEWRSIMYSPSLTAQTDFDVSSGVQLEEDLLVFAPLVTGDSSAFPFAQMEVNDIVALVPHATVYAGREASKSAFLRAAPGSRVIHFTGHSTLDALIPYRANLMFGNSSNKLSTAELSNVELSSVQLIVLASCTSAIDQDFANVSRFGMAQAFLARGVGGVLGSMWEVSDSETRVFMRRFYSEFLAGKTPAAALAFIQKERAAETGRPDWAAWRLVGRM